jgi:hypothetical protein
MDTASLVMSGVNFAETTKGVTKTAMDDLARS